MDARQYLEQVYDMKNHIKRLNQELDSYRELASSMPGCNLDERINKQRSTEAPFVKYIYKIMDLEDEIKTETGRLEIMKLEIGHQINMLEDTNERLVLRYRYLVCMPWNEIADRLHYSIRYVYKIHGRALQHFEKRTP